MQPVDFTTIAAVVTDLQNHWLPARCEQVYQRDAYTLFMALRTIESRGWLAISWHPQAARIHMSQPPPKQPDTFTFSQQLKHQLGGLALANICYLSPWERVLDLQFSHRPDEPPLWHLYVEVMGKYSNVILTTAQQQIVTAAHQVSDQQSSLRPIQTGQPYRHPPGLRQRLPKLEESFADWQEHLALIPGPLKKMIVKAYGGVSSPLATQLIEAAGLAEEVATSDLTEKDWQQLFIQWQNWLSVLRRKTFLPGWKTGRLQDGYTVLGLGMKQPADSVQTLLDEYYSYQFNREQYRRLYHRLSQRLKALLTKLYQKADTFKARLDDSAQADDYRHQADLLMANLHLWQPGITSLSMRDFADEKTVVLSLEPEKSAVQNAQRLYRQHQKLKRASKAVTPLLADVRAELSYLEQVEDSLLQMGEYAGEADLRSLEEICRELIAQGYLRDATGYEGGWGARSAKKASESGESFRRYRAPQGMEILVGRNNSQNEQLTFKQASDYDLWLHAQEIPGSHVLLRMNAGEVPSDETLQLAADLAAFYSRARQSDQVPVVYTEPRNVAKPKGALPGMVTYRRERVIWGQPQRAKSLIEQGLAELSENHNSSLPLL